MTACQVSYQEIDAQPSRSDRHRTVISAATLTVDNPATNVGIDGAQTETAGNFPDYRPNLALVSAYLIAATNRDYAPLHALKHTIGTDAGIRNASGNVRPSLQRLARLRQIRLAAMGWKRLLGSGHADDVRFAQAFTAAANLLKEVMKPS